MSLAIESPQLTDIDELLKLYFLIYGQNYPVAYGTDPEFMAEAMNSDCYEWRIMRDRDKGLIVGSIVFELDRMNKVGKAAALVVHPDYRKAGIASQLAACGDPLLAADGFLNSLYTTTRTQSAGPQLIYLREGYLPLGIFPNAHKLRRYETTTLFAKFKAGVLEKRARTQEIPQKLLPLYAVVREKFPGLEIPEVASSSDVSIKKVSRQEFSFEAIFAPHYVLRHFREQITDPYAQFYPFHLPNLLLAEENGNIEVFAYFNKSDGYCTLISFNCPLYTIEDSLPVLLEQLHCLGVSYVEVLVGADRLESLETLLRAQFLPSALYPAMREVNGKTYDFVIMTRTMQPLDFHGMAVEQAFKPYVDQYVALWKQMHLETLEVFNDYK